MSDTWFYITKDKVFDSQDEALSSRIGDYTDYENPLFCYISTDYDYDKYEVTGIEKLFTVTKSSNVFVLNYIKTNQDTNINGQIQVDLYKSEQIVATDNIKYNIEEKGTSLDGQDEYGKYVMINDYKYYVYANIADCDKYCAAVNNSTWHLLTPVQKAQLLVMATRQIDSYNYIGSKLDPNQPLKFPRIKTNNVVSDDNVLRELCCQVANFFNTYGSSSSTSTEFLQNISKWQIGDFNVTLKDDADLKFDVDTFDDLIQRLLKDWLISQSMEIWL